MQKQQYKNKPQAEIGKLEVCRALVDSTVVAIFSAGVKHIGVSVS